MENCESNKYEECNICGQISNIDTLRIITDNDSKRYECKNGILCKLWKDGTIQKLCLRNGISDIKNISEKSIEGNMEEEEKEEEEMEEETEEEMEEETEEEMEKTEKMDIKMFFFILPITIIIFSVYLYFENKLYD